MKGVRRIVVAIVGMGLFGALIGEHVNRRDLERRYREAMDSRRQLAMQVGELTAGHQEIKRDLDSEQRRSRELSEALMSTRAQLEETVGRLTEETRSAGELKMRLAAVQRQMDQVQGELANALQERTTIAKPEPSTPVQLERIVVSSANASTLQGRVISVHQDWDFVVIDLGWNAVRIGETVSIFRNDRLLAKAKVERVQEEASAATVLPGWKATDIQPNDLVRILGVSDETADRS